MFAPFLARFLDSLLFIFLFAVITSLRSDAFSNYHQVGQYGRHIGHLTFLLTISGVSAIRSVGRQFFREP